MKYPLCLQDTGIYKDNTCRAKGMTKVTTILSYVERGKQPIRELTVSVTKYRSCVEKERYKGILATISTFMVVRVVAQYR